MVEHNSEKKLTYSHCHGAYLIMVVGALMERYPNRTDFKGEDSRNKAGEVGRWQTLTVVGFGSVVHS